jgi:hypothetical protein
LGKHVRSPFDHIRGGIPQLVSLLINIDLAGALAAFGAIDLVTGEEYNLLPLAIVHRI